MKRLLIALAIAGLAGTGVARADVTFGTPKLLGQFILPTGVSFEGVEFGGISGLDYDPKNDVYYGVSDDRSEHGPARFYVLKLKIDDKGVHGLDIVKTVPLKDADGKEFAIKSIDPESIRFDAATGHLFWSSEGDAAGNPGIYEATTDGALVRSFKLPDYYLPNADHTQGVVDNASFESLSLSKDGKFLYAGLENGLVQDGGKTTLDAGSLSRILKLDLASGAVAAEYPLEIEKIPNKASNGKTNDNGMSEFMLLSDDTFLTMERSFALGYGNEINFYTAKIAGASDVAGKPVIKDMGATPAAKQKVMQIREGDFGLDIDNIECLTWGPMIDGKPTIVIAADNNFNPNGEYNQFVVLTLDGFKAE